MAESPTPEPKPAPQPAKPALHRRSWAGRWFRRALLALPVLLVLLVIGLCAARTYFRATGHRELAKETARLDAEDPGWRWDDLKAAREKAAPPDAENSAVVVRRVRAQIPEEWRAWLSKQSAGNEAPLPLNRRQEFGALTRDDNLAEATRPARDLGLTLRDYPRGYHVVTLENEMFISSLDETQGAREVAALLKTDAILAAQEGDPIRGLRAARAILNTARSIGDEPSIISSLVRFACGMIAAETAMRILALTDPQTASIELASLQTALFAELEEPVLANALRGERATIDRFFERVDNGTIDAEAMARLAQTKPSAGGRVSLYFFRTFVPEDRRRFLRLMSDLIDAAKGPPHERIQASTRVENEVRANWDMRYPWHRLMLPASGKVMESSVRIRAELLSAATLIACERFRLARGRWPESLAELPKELLPAIPIDPYTGEPMKFAKLADGITVYSVGTGTTSDRDKPRLTNPLGGTELGWRLYDPKQRGLPPLPPPKPEPIDPDAP